MKSAAKSAKDEGDIDEASKSSSKRKRSSQKKVCLSVSVCHVAIFAFVCFYIMLHLFMNLFSVRAF